MLKTTPNSAQVTIRCWEWHPSLLHEKHSLSPLNLSDSIFIHVKIYFKIHFKIKLILLELPQEHIFLTYFFIYVLFRLLLLLHRGYSILRIHFFFFVFI